MEYIPRERLDTKELLTKISRKEISSDHFVIGLRTKERELAISPRCYGMLTLEMRTLVCPHGEEHSRVSLPILRLPNDDV